MKNIEFHECTAMSLCNIATKYRNPKECQQNCNECAIETAEWLLKEHVTDWSRVTPFVPVRVKDNRDVRWNSGFFFIGYHRVNDIEYYVVSDTPEPIDASSNFIIFDCCRLASEFYD